jgi:hypothetical protein
MLDTALRVNYCETRCEKFVETRCEKFVKKVVINSPFE